MRCEDIINVDVCSDYMYSFLDEKDDELKCFRLNDCVSYGNIDKRCPMDWMQH